MALWPPKKKDGPVASPIVRQRESALYIFFTVGSTVSYACKVPERGSLALPWRDFVKWYHCRPQSPTFTIPYNKGSYTVRRDLIHSFRISEEYK
jgi:hypothetical protein